MSKVDDVAELEKGNKRGRRLLNLFVILTFFDFDFDFDLPFVFLSFLYINMVMTCCAVSLCVYINVVRVRG